MTILLSILGVHLVNVFFIFFTVARIMSKNKLEHAYNMRYLLWLFFHPFLNILAIISIFINGEEGLTAICKEKNEKE